MSNENTKTQAASTLAHWPQPAKILATMTVLMLTIGMAGALGQIIVHDILPTFWGDASTATMQMDQPETVPSERGDLFAETAPLPSEPASKPLHETEEFIYALKFTHIHIFGMSGIFIVMGALVVFLDLSAKVRGWLIALPFVGIVIDLASVWFKIFVHPAFFWLHIPGGMMFGIVFAIESVLILRQMWTVPAGVRTGQETF
jgi:hypothetical protein